MRKRLAYLTEGMEVASATAGLHPRTVPPEIKIRCRWELQLQVTSWIAASLAPDAVSELTGSVHVQEDVRFGAASLLPLPLARYARCAKALAHARHVFASLPHPPPSLCKGSDRGKKDHELNIQAILSKEGHLCLQTQQEGPRAEHPGRAQNADLKMTSSELHGFQLDANYPDRSLGGPSLPPVDSVRWEDGQRRREGSSSGSRRRLPPNQNVHSPKLTVQEGLDPYSALFISLSLLQSSYGKSKASEDAKRIVDKERGNARLEIESAKDSAHVSAST